MQARLPAKVLSRRWRVSFGRAQCVDMETGAARLQRNDVREIAWEFLRELNALEQHYWSRITGKSQNGQKFPGFDPASELENPSDDVRTLLALHKQFVAQRARAVEHVVCPTRSQLQALVDSPAPSSDDLRDAMAVCRRELISVAEIAQAVIDVGEKVLRVNQPLLEIDKEYDGFGILQCEVGAVTHAARTVSARLVMLDCTPSSDIPSEPHGNGLLEGLVYAMFEWLNRYETIMQKVHTSYRRSSIAGDDFRDWLNIVGLSEHSGSVAWILEQLEEDHERLVDMRRRMVEDKVRKTKRVRGPMMEMQAMAQRVSDLWAFARDLLAALKADLELPAVLRAIPKDHDAWADDFKAWVCETADSLCYGVESWLEVFNLYGATLGLEEQFSHHAVPSPRRGVASS